MRRLICSVIAAVMLLAGAMAVSAGAVYQDDPGAEHLVQRSGVATGIVSSDLLPDVAEAAMGSLTLTIERQGCETCVDGPYAPDLSFNANGMGVAVFERISTPLVGETFILYWSGEPLGEPMPGPEAYGEGHIYTVIVGVYGDQTFIANIHHERQIVWCGAHIGYCNPSKGTQDPAVQCPANFYLYKANDQPLICLPY